MKQPIMQSKAMLVIDMPKCCEVCPFVDKEEFNKPYCKIGHLVHCYNGNIEFVCKPIPFDDYVKDVKPNWCLLKVLNME